MFRPSAPELILFFFIVLVLLGPKRLPEVGRSLGKGLREFKESIGGSHDDEPEDHEISVRHNAADQTEPKKSLLEGSGLDRP